VSRIVDTIYARESDWILQNLLIITYDRIDANSQSYVGIKYEPFSKEIALLLNDDAVRAGLLYSFEGGRENRLISGLNGLLEGFPLWPYVLNIVNDGLNQSYYDPSALLYWLALDAYRNTESSAPLVSLAQPASQKSIDAYKRILHKIEYAYSTFLRLLNTYYAGNSNSEKQNRLQDVDIMIQTLISAVRSQNSLDFARALLWYLDIILKNKGKDTDVSKAVNDLTSFCVSNIVQNKHDFMPYAMSLVLALASIARQVQ